MLINESLLLIFVGIIIMSADYLLSGVRVNDLICINDHLKDSDELQACAHCTSQISSPQLSLSSDGCCWCVWTSLWSHCSTLCCCCYTCWYHTTTLSDSVCSATPASSRGYYWSIIINQSLKSREERAVVRTASYQRDRVVDTVITAHHHQSRVHHHRSHHHHQSSQKRRDTSSIMTWGFQTCGPNEAMVVSGLCVFYNF